MVYTIEELREKIVPLAEKYQVSAVYLFGSYSRCEADEKSDVDLVIQVTDSLAVGFSFYTFWEELEKELGLDVDMMTLEGLSTNRTYIGCLVRQAFEKERVTLYENRTVGA